MGKYDARGQGQRALFPHSKETMISQNTRHPACFVCAYLTAAKFRAVHAEVERRQKIFRAEEILTLQAAAVASALSSSRPHCSILPTSSSIRESAQPVSGRDDPGRRQGRSRASPKQGDKVMQRGQAEGVEGGDMGGEAARGSGAAGRRAGCRPSARRRAPWVSATHASNGSQAAPCRSASACGASARWQIRSVSA